MMRIFLTLTLRVWRRSPLFTALNLLGLFFAFTASLIVVDVVLHERSYDRFWPGADAIHRVGMEYKVAGDTVSRSSATAAIMAPALAGAVPEIRHLARIRPARPTIAVDDARFAEPVFHVDPAFADIFPLTVLAGDLRRALAEPNGAVLTRTQALRLFGDEAPLGRRFVLDGRHTVAVVAVVADLPANTHLDLGILVGWETASNPALALPEREHWFHTGVRTYVRFADGVDPAALADRVADLLERAVPDSQRPAGVATVAEFAAARFDPVTSIHLHSIDPAGLGARSHGSAVAVNAYTAAIVLLLLMAAVNFTTLTTAHNATRGREVAVRKVLGARRPELMAQVLGESVLFALLAFALALSAAELVGPLFGQFVGWRTGAAAADRPAVLAGFLAVAILIGVLAGTWPAILLSREGIDTAFRRSGSAVTQGGGGGLRTGLVVLQFAISIALSIVTVVTWLQTEHARTLSPGFDRSNLVLITGGHRPEVRAVWPQLRDRIAQVPGVVGVTASNMVPTGHNAATTSVRHPDDPPGVPGRDMLDLSVDPAFFATFGVARIAGRDFAWDRAGDLGATDTAGQPRPVVLNRLAAARLGFATPEAVLGRTLRLAADADRSAEVTVVGVVEDFNLYSARDPMRAMIFRATDAGNTWIALRLAPGQERAALAEVERAWAGLVGPEPLRAEFLAERMAAVYAGDVQQDRTLLGFAGLAAAVALLGAFGIAAFTTERRRREIGLRKVLGASEGQIVRLLLWQMTRPVLLANIVAWPVAFLYLTDWLGSFADRIQLDPAVFLVCGGATLLTVAITVATQAWTAATTPPVRVFRME